MASIRYLLAMLFALGSLLATAAGPAGPTLERLAADIAARVSDPDERARAAFDWIAQHIDYDGEAYQHRKVPELKPDDILRSGKTVCQGYAELLTALLGKLGVKSASIPGYAKGGGYIEGEHFSRKNHQWNAIRLKKGWVLVDVTWGAGSVDSEGRFTRQYSGFWFDVPPSLFAINHYPADSRYAFLPRQPTLADWENGFHIGAGILEQLLSNGFSAAQILAGVQLRSLPAAYQVENPQLQIISAPPGGVLRQGQRYMFEVQAAPPTKVALQIGEQTLSPEWQGDIARFSITIPAIRGQLYLLRSRNQGQHFYTDYDLVASWRIVD